MRRESQHVRLSHLVVVHVAKKENSSMNPIVGAISVLALNLPISAEESQADPGTPAEQYAALLREYRPASGGMREAKSDLQRKAVVERLGTFPLKFVELAGCSPKRGTGRC